MKILKSITAIWSMLSLVLYQYLMQINEAEAEIKGIELEAYTGLDEMWFVTIILTVVVFGFSSINKKDSILTNSLVVLCSVFYAAIVFIYLYRWCLFGDGSTNYYKAICGTATLTLIYLFIHSIYYAFKRKSNIFKRR